MESGGQLLLPTPLLMVRVSKEAPAMAGKVWKMMPWAWAVEEVMGQEDGAAQEAVKEVLKVQAVDQVLTERTASKEETEGSPQTLQP